jgi:gliding motility-associated-like protein
MKRLIIIAVFILSLTEVANAQIVMSNPSLGFSQACASSTFNTYHVTFSFSTSGDLDESNQFVVELSDANGDFSESTDIYTSEAGSITTSPATLTFSFPTTVAGEDYEIKIRSTTPAGTSGSSTSFAAYYKIQDSPFTINNLVATGSYCSSGSYLLTIDNPGTGTNDSPLQYPSLTYKWYKETSATTSEFVDYGNSLSVNSPGVYFVETDYGTCTSSSFSNRVTISESESDLSTFEIESSLEIPYCASDGPTTLSAISGDFYQWFVDGEIIEGATDQMYTTNVEGVYTVDVDYGTCSATASIDLINTDFTASIDVDDYNEIDADETLVINVSTTANDPEITWYLDDTSIAKGTSYEASESGIYKVEVLQTTGCVSTKTFLFEVTVNGEEVGDLFPNVEQIPNIISPNNDGTNDTWIIPKDYVSGTNSKVIIFSSQGKIVFKSENYENNWPVNEIEFKSVNPIYYYIITTENNETRKGSITVIR